MNYITIAQHNAKAVYELFQPIVAAGVVKGTARVVRRAFEDFNSRYAFKNNKGEKFCTELRFAFEMPLYDNGILDNVNASMGYHSNKAEQLQELMFHWVLSMREGKYLEPGYFLGKDSDIEPEIEFIAIEHKWDPKKTGYFFQPVVKVELPEEEVFEAMSARQKLRILFDLVELSKFFRADFFSVLQRLDNDSAEYERHLKLCDFAEDRVDVSLITKGKSWETVFSFKEVEFRVKEAQEHAASIETSPEYARHEPGSRKLLKQHCESKVVGLLVVQQALNVALPDSTGVGAAYIEQVEEKKKVIVMSPGLDEREYVFDTNDKGEWKMDASLVAFLRPTATDLLAEGERAIREGSLLSDEETAAWMAEHPVGNVYLVPEKALAKREPTIDEEVAAWAAAQREKNGAFLQGEYRGRQDPVEALIHNA